MRAAKGGIFVWCVWCVAAGSVWGAGRFLSQDAPAGPGLGFSTAPTDVGWRERMRVGRERREPHYCLLFIAFVTYFKFNPTMYPIYQPISDCKRI